LCEQLSLSFTAPATAAASIARESDSPLVSSYQPPRNQHGAANGLGDLRGKILAVVICWC
jgi:hypothetical protein